MRVSRDLGFTLVEVLIVIVIMAIVAAIIIPQYGSSTDDARRSTGEFNVSTLRTLIQSYKAQHSGLNPAYDSSAKSLSVFLSKTNADGTIDPTGLFGPYLTEFPDNPMTNVREVKLITNNPPTSADVTAGNAGGWLYNASSGNIWLDSNPGFSY